jgi:hypothetical protein
LTPAVFIIDFAFHFILLLPPLSAAVKNNHRMTREVCASQETSSVKGASNAILVDKIMVQQKGASTFEKGLLEDSVPSGILESAYSLTVLRKVVSGNELMYRTVRGSGHNIPSNIVAEDNEDENRPLEAKPLPIPSAIRLNSSFLVKKPPRAISAVSGKAILKDAYTGSKKKRMMQQKTTKIGQPLAMPPRLPSVRAGQVIVLAKRKRTAIP